jgi:hypothetical protein
MAEAVADRLQRLHRLGRHLRTDAVARQHGNDRFHGCGSVAILDANERAGPAYSRASPRL